MDVGDEGEKSAEVGDVDAGVWGKRLRRLDSGPVAGWAKDICFLGCSAAAVSSPKRSSPSESDEYTSLSSWSNS